MKVAITGASGYLGGCISETFRNHGHQVLSLSRRACGTHWIPYSLGDDPRQLPWDDVDLLIHAAYDFEPHTWEKIVDRNVKPSIGLLNAAAMAKVENMIFISSMSSFDGCRSAYGKAKQMIENAALDVGATVVRPGLVWGGISGGVMGALERAVTRFPIIPYPCGGTGSMQRMIHLLDLSEALVALAACMRPANRDLVSIANPTPLSIRDILQTIANRKCLTRAFIPFPWQGFMAGLRAAEGLDIRIPFRSDSLSGLIHGNPFPKIDPSPAGVDLRPFE